jgi:hypothetical protein
MKLLISLFILASFNVFAKKADLGAFHKEMKKEIYNFSENPHLYETTDRHKRLPASSGTVEPITEEALKAEDQMEEDYIYINRGNGDW